MAESLTFFDKEAAQIWSLVDNNSTLLHSAMRDDGYTPWQVLVHIVTATRGLIEMGLAQIEPDAGWFMPTADINVDTLNAHQQKTWEHRSMDELRELWATARPMAERFAASVTEDHSLLHPLGTHMPGPEFLKFLTIHMRMHRQELEAGLAALTEPAA